MRGSDTPPLFMGFIYHRPRNNHSRFIFPELHSFQRLTAGSFGQLQTGVSVTRHIASNCMCHRERSVGFKSSSVRNKSWLCLALGRWCLHCSGGKKQSLADNTVPIGLEQFPLYSTTIHQFQSNCFNYTSAEEVWRKSSYVFDVKLPTGSIFLWLRNLKKLWHVFAQQTPTRF